MAAWVEGDKNFVKKQFDRVVLSDIFFFLKYYQEDLSIPDDYLVHLRDLNKDDAL